MSSLVGTAVSDCRDLGAEMEKFLVGPSFEEVWNSFQIQPMTPMEYLGEIFVAGSGHETNEFYESELQNLSSDAPITKEKTLALLSYLQAGTTRVLMEINTNHKPVFEGLFKQSVEFVEFVASMFKIHQQTIGKLCRSNPNEMFNRVSRRTLTAEGLRNIESFLACSEKFHEELRDTIKQVAEDASQQYNQSANLIRTNLQKNQAYLKRQQDQLESTIKELKQADSILGEDWPKIYKTIQQSHQSILETVLLLIKESPKVIRGSFELVEYAIESVCTVLKKIKTLADEKGYSSKPVERNPLQEELDLKLLKVPDECAEIIFQKHLSKSFVESRTLKIVATLEGDKLQKMMNLLLGDWYNHCAPILTPVGSKVVRTEVQGIPSTIVNMLPTFQSSELLARVKVIQGKLSVKSIPTQVSIGLCPGQMIVTGSALNASVLLIIPNALMVACKHINNFLGSKNGLAILTARGEISFYFKEAEERDQIMTWVEANIKQPLTLGIQSVLNRFSQVVSVDGQAGELDFRSEHVPLLKARELRCKLALYWLGQAGVKQFSQKTVFPMCSVYRILPLMVGYSDGNKTNPGAFVELVLTESSSQDNPKNEYRVGNLPAFLLPMNQNVTGFWQNFLKSPDTLFHFFRIMDHNLLLDIIQIQMLFASVDTLYVVVSSEQNRHPPRFFQLYQNGGDAEVWETDSSEEPANMKTHTDWKELVRSSLNPKPANTPEQGTEALVNSN